MLVPRTTIQRCKSLQTGGDTKQTLAAELRDFEEVLDYKVQCIDGGRVIVRAPNRRKPKTKTLNIPVLTRPSLVVRLAWICAILGRLWLVLAPYRSGGLTASAVTIDLEQMRGPAVAAASEPYWAGEAELLDKITLHHYYHIGGNAIQDESTLREKVDTDFLPSNIHPTFWGAVLDTAKEITHDLVVLPYRRLLGRESAISSQDTSTNHPQGATLWDKRLLASSLDMASPSSTTPDSDPSASFMSKILLGYPLSFHSKYFLPRSISLDQERRLQQNISPPSAEWIPMATLFAPSLYLLTKLGTLALTLYSELLLGGSLRRIFGMHVARRALGFYSVLNLCIVGMHVHLGTWNWCWSLCNIVLALSIQLTFAFAECISASAESSNSDGPQHNSNPLKKDGEEPKVAIEVPLRGLTVVSLFNKIVDSEMLGGAGELTDEEATNTKSTQRGFSLRRLFYLGWLAALAVDCCPESLVFVFPVIFLPLFGLGLVVLRILPSSQKWRVLFRLFFTACAIMLAFALSLEYLHLVRGGRFTTGMNVFGQLRAYISRYTHSLLQGILLALTGSSPMSKRISSFFTSLTVSSNDIYLEGFAIATQFALPLVIFSFVVTRRLVDLLAVPCHVWLRPAALTYYLWEHVCACQVLATVYVMWLVMDFTWSVKLLDFIPTVTTTGVLTSLITDRLFVQGKSERLCGSHESADSEYVWIGDEEVAKVIEDVESAVSKAAAAELASDDESDSDDNDDDNIEEKASNSGDGGDPDKDERGESKQRSDTKASEPAPSRPRGFCRLFSCALRLLMLPFRLIRRFVFPLALLGLVLHHHQAQSTVLPTIRRKAVSVLPVDEASFTEVHRTVRVHHSPHITILEPGIHMVPLASSGLLSIKGVEYALQVAGVPPSVIRETTPVLQKVCDPGMGAKAEHIRWMECSFGLVRANSTFITQPVIVLRAQSTMSSQSVDGDLARDSRQWIDKLRTMQTHFTKEEKGPPAEANIELISPLLTRTEMMLRDMSTWVTKGTWGR